MSTPNPCVGVCDAMGSIKCKGCGRTSEEKFFWTSMDDQKKAKIIRRAASEGFFNKAQFVRLKSVL